MDHLRVVEVGENRCWCNGYKHRTRGAETREHAGEGGGGHLVCLSDVKKPTTATKI